MAEKEHWHLDKRVPIATIATLGIWIITTVWWAAALNERVAHLETMAIKNQNVESRLVRIEERQNWMGQLEASLAEPEAA